MEDTRFTAISCSSSGSEFSATKIVSLTEAVEGGLVAVTVAVAGAAEISGAVASIRVAW